MASAVPVVEEAEDYSFLPIIHDVIKWWEVDILLFYVSRHRMRISRCWFHQNAGIFRYILTRYRRLCVHNGSCVWRRSVLPFCLRSSVNSMDKDSPDVHQELNKLKTKIQEAREQVAAMPGIDLSPALQESRLRMLREQVRTKNQLLQKYKSLCMFDIPKPSWHWKYSKNEHEQLFTRLPVRAGV